MNAGVRLGAAGASGVTPPLAVAGRTREAAWRTVRLSLHQFHYDLRAFLRNSQSRFFTLALPVMFLVILAGVFGHHTTRIPGGEASTSVVYVPGIMTLGIVAASFINLVIAVTAQRESGVLKRRRATPVPAAAVIAGRALTSVCVALAIVAVLLGVGWVAYGVHVPGHTLLALAVTVVVGALSFCCLGFALTTVIHDQESAQPVTQAIMLPLYFISGVFVATSSFPRWLGDVAGVFPVRHLVSALLSAYNPYTVGAGFDGKDLLIIVAWGLGGLLVAVRRFQWMSLAH